MSLSDVSLDQERPLYQRAICCIPAASAPSTTPSPVRSRFAFAYQNASSAGNWLENCTPDGSKPTENSSGSMVRVTRTESPGLRGAPPPPASSDCLGTL